MAMASTHIPNKLSVWARMKIYFEIMSYHRAASVLRRYGLNGEAQRCIDIAKSLAQ